MYKVGDVVQHETFGCGVVVKVESRDAEGRRPIVIVSFENDSQKQRRFTDVSLSEQLVK